MGTRLSGSRAIGYRSPIRGWRTDPGLRRTIKGMPILGVIFDLGSTLIHRTGLELEKEKCGALADVAAAQWGCRDPAGLAARLLEIRLDAWRRSDEELVEHPATGSIAQAFTEAGLPTGGERLLKAEA